MTIEMFAQAKSPDYRVQETTGKDITNEKAPMTMRIKDAIDAATLQDTTHYAFPMIEGMSPREDLAIVVVSPDEDHGWRIVMFEGRYDAEMRITRRDRPGSATLREMQNLVFHPVEAMPASDVLAAVDLVRMLEGYDEDVVLHPHAARTVVEARRSEDSRVPIVRPSPFLTLMRAAGITGAILTLANVVAITGLLITWGHFPLQVRQYVLSTTIVTLALLAASPMLLLRLNRYALLFSRPAAQRTGRSATMLIGQMVVLLAVFSAMNGIIVLS